MSLDVYLIRKGEQVYWANITHNLGGMADAAGIYEALWNPRDIGIKTAKGLIKRLENGLKLMKEDPEKFEEYNSSNGWGRYRDFVPWIEKYLEACKEYPGAKVVTSV